MALEIDRETIEALAWDRATLYDWYLNSISNEDPPVWTEEHLDELFKDFYLIKK